MRIEPAAALSLAAVIGNDLRAVAGIEAHASQLLSDLLGFRHLFRNAYDFTLDERRTVDLWKRWQLEGAAVKDSLSSFATRLTALGE